MNSSLFIAIMHVLRTLHKQILEKDLPYAEDLRNAIHLLLEEHVQQEKKYALKERQRAEKLAEKLKKVAQIKDVSDEQRKAEAKQAIDEEQAQVPALDEDDAEEPKLDNDARETKLANEGFSILLRLHASYPDINEINYLLARCYYDGYGVAQNKNKAFELMSKAAENNYSPAWSSLAWYYFGGHGVQENIETSRKCRHRSIYAEDGSIRDDAFLVAIWNEALDLLNGTFYGKPSIKDSKKGQELIQIAADRGYPEAQFHLGHQLLQNGNEAEALKYFRFALLGKEANAINFLTQILLRKVFPLLQDNPSQTPAKKADPKDLSLTPNVEDENAKLNEMAVQYGNIGNPEKERENEKFQLFSELLEVANVLKTAYFKDTRAALAQNNIAALLDMLHNLQVIMKRDLLTVKDESERDANLIRMALLGDKDSQVLAGCMLEGHHFTLEMSLDTYICLEFNPARDIPRAIAVYQTGENAGSFVSATRLAWRYEYGIFHNMFKNAVQEFETISEADHKAWFEKEQQYQLLMQQKLENKKAKEKAQQQQGSSEEIQEEREDFWDKMEREKFEEPVSERDYLKALEHYQKADILRSMNISLSPMEIDMSFLRHSRSEGGMPPLYLFNKTKQLAVVYRVKKEVDAGLKACNTALPAGLCDLIANYHGVEGYQVRKHNLKV